MTFWPFRKNGLKRYYIIETCRWNFFKFSWIVQYRKTSKLGLKAGDHHAISWVLEVKTSKIEQKRTVFVYILGFIFYGVSHAKTNLNIWFAFVFGSLFEQNWLLDNKKYFKTEANVALNLIDDFFFLVWIVRICFHKKDFKQKKYGVTGLISAKMETL